MKSKLVILSLLLAGATAATAQTKETFYSESFKDSIFVSVGIDAQGCVNPNSFDYGFGKTIAPLINVLVGKLFDPVQGIRGRVAGTRTTLYSNYEQPADTYIKSKNKHCFTLRADGMSDLSNATGGYNPDRLFTVPIFAGPGLTFVKAHSDQDKVSVLINGFVGLAGQFNIGKYLDINTEAKDKVSPSPFGNINSTHTDGAVSLTAGVTYTFSDKRFVSCGSQVDQNVINEELNCYRGELAKVQSDLADTRNTLAGVKPATREVAKEVEAAGPRAILFQIGKSRIDDYGVVNIQLTARILETSPDKKYKVAGYADKAAGSTKWDQKLPETRVQVVYDALIKEGVSKGQLELISFGGTANMFDKSFLNRVAILKQYNPIGAVAR